MGIRARFVAIGIAAMLIGALPAHATIGLFSQQASAFFFKNSPSPGVADLVVPFGPPGRNFIPLTGDWNGDGEITVGLWDPQTSLFYLRNSNTPGVADITFQFGPPSSGWIPIAGDWNGDNVDTIGLYDPAASFFHLRNSNTPGNGQVFFAFGPPRTGWLPVAGDWNGDGFDSIGLYDAVSDTFFLRNTLSGGVAEIQVSFTPKLINDRPIAGDFNGDGFDTVSRYDTFPSVFQIHNDFAPGAPDFGAAFGPPNNGWLPVTWKPSSNVQLLDPTDGAGRGFLWKPISEGQNTGNLTVLLPSSFNNEVAAVEIHSAIPPNQNTFIAGSFYTGIHNGNRGHWRFRRPGRDFDRVYVVVFGENGQIFAYFIEDGADRVD